MARGRSPLTMEGCGNSYPITRLLNTFITSNRQDRSTIHKSWGSGNFHHVAIVEGHTGGSRSVPTVHPCSLKWEEAVGSSQAPQPNKNNAHKSHAQLPHPPRFSSLRRFVFFPPSFCVLPSVVLCSSLRRFVFFPPSFCCFLPSVVLLFSSLRRFVVFFPPSFCFLPSVVLFSSLRRFVFFPPSFFSSPSFFVSLPFPFTLVFFPPRFSLLSSPLRCLFTSVSSLPPSLVFFFAPSPVFPPSFFPSFFLLPRCFHPSLGVFLLPSVFFSSPRFSAPLMNFMGYLKVWEGSKHNTRRIGTL